jgi:hypothetical protein
VAVGHLVGYGAGALDLSSIFGTLIGDTQFKQLTVIAALALMIAVGVTCWAVEERVLVATGYDLYFVPLGLLLTLSQRRRKGRRSGCSAYADLQDHQESTQANTDGKIIVYRPLNFTEKLTSHRSVGFNSGPGLVCDEGVRSKISI